MNFACSAGRLKVLLAVALMGQQSLSCGMKHAYLRISNLSARPKQPDRFVAFKQIQQMAQRLAALGGEGRIAREDELRVLAGGLQQGAVNLDTSNLEARHAGLARAQHIALAAQAQILLGDAEAGFALAQNLDA